MMQERSTFASVWSAFLVFGSTAASLIFACATPFAALAAVAALTLPPRLALITTMGVWLGNQAVGFLMLGYPLTASALAWGPILGGAAIVATAVAIQVSAQFDRADLRHGLAVFAAALATQQGLVLAASLFEGTASLTVAAGVSALNAVWAAGLAVVHRLAVGVAARAELAAAR
jgi:hypothetical protein